MLSLRISSHCVCRRSIHALDTFECCSPIVSIRQKDCLQQTEIVVNILVTRKPFAGVRFAEKLDNCHARIVFLQLYSSNPTWSLEIHFEATYVLREIPFQLHLIAVCRILRRAGYDLVYSAKQPGVGFRVEVDKREDVLEIKIVPLCSPRVSLLPLVAIPDKCV